MGVQGRHATIDEGCVLFGGVGMPQSMEGNAPARYGRVTDGVTVAEDELLHAVDGTVGGNAVRHQQLVTAFRFLQQPLQHHRDTVVLDGDDTDFTALALYGEGIFTQGTLRRSGVHAEALVDLEQAMSTILPTTSAYKRYSDSFFFLYAEAYLTVTVMHDVTVERQRTQSENIRKASIQEAHHRIKNSLNIIYSLLDMQRRRCGEEAAESLRTAMNRIISVVNVYDVTGEAVPDVVALVINELLQNAYKYAFPGRKDGNVHIELNNGSLYPLLTVADDGVGFDVNSGTGAGMGYRIINMLVQNNLGGRLDVRSGPEGTRVTFGIHPR